MELIFLGTSAGIPTKGRNVTSLALNLQDSRSAFWLFDCGEGTQHQMLHTRLSAGKIEKIFITHLHGDHLFGLPGLLCSRSMAGCQTPLTLYGPAGLKTFIDNTLSLSGSYLTYPLEVVEIISGAVCEDERRVVTAYPMSHTLTCVGYRIEERPKPGALDVARLTQEGIRPGPWFQQLKRGESVTLEDGRILNGADYLGPSTPGRSLAIFGDTRPSEAGRLLAAGVDVMVHEATMEANMAESANKRGHSTTEQAATLAREAGAGRLIITHISARYGQEDSERLLAECRAIFPATEIAADLTTFRV